MAGNRRNLPALSIGRNVHSGRQPKPVPTVSNGVSERTVAPDRERQTDNRETTQSRRIVQPTPTIRELIRYLHGQPRTLAELIEYLNMSGGHVLQMVRTARSVGWQITAVPSRPTTYEFHPPETT